MASPVEDRILYVDQEEESDVARPRPLAMVLVGLAMVAGILYLARELTSDGPSKSVSTLDPIATVAELAAIPELAVFDASSGDFISCVGSLQAPPDFAIVVAGAGSGASQQEVSRVVQFFVVTTYLDHRYGRDVRIQSLCTLP